LLSLELSKEDDSWSLNVVVRGTSGILGMEESNLIFSLSNWNVTFLEESLVLRTEVGNNKLVVSNFLLNGVAISKS